MPMHVQPFYDSATSTMTYVIHAGEGTACAVIDPVLDYDVRAARTSTGSAEAVVDYIQQHKLSVEWLLETHAHADHLSAGHWLRSKLGGRLAIGERITEVQSHFARLYHLSEDVVKPDGRQFDHLFTDGERFRIGDLQAEVIATPGHTPACICYKIEDAVFVGDTLFMPDHGTARTDFPGGDAEAMYTSIQRLYALPDETKMFMCHDYQPGGREVRWETSVGEQRRTNIVLNASTDKAAFIAERQAKDATLSAPLLIWPSLQVNIRAGALPEPEENGISYLKLPLNILGAAK